MKTKEEIEEVMDDEITVGDCFLGAIPTDEDKEIFLRIRGDVRSILENERSITVAAKRLFEEVLSMDFDEKQWYAMVMVLIVSVDLGKRVGADRTLQFLSEMRGL